ncbi:MAG: glycosyltransferase family 2 protein [bacterium]
MAAVTRMAGSEHDPVVSIVTPSFNQGRFIAETIDSVLSQDYPHVEYQVIDGNSTDATLEILRRYDGRLSWVSEPDRGQSHAINKGWRRSRGEIIAWLNADDLYRPGAIRRVVEFFRAHPHVDLVYGDCEYIGERGEVVRRYPLRQVNWAELIMSPYTMIAQPAAFLRRGVLETVGYLNETLHYAMDLEYWMRVAIRHHIACLPEYLAAFRFHAVQKSGSQQLARLSDERLRVHQQFFESPDLPDHVRRLEREAMRNAYWRAANDHFSFGNIDQARRYALAAWRCLPWKPGRTQLKVLFLSLAAPGWARLAAWLKTFAG